MLFKLLPDWAKWIARDKDYCVWFYANKPEKNDYECHSDKGKVTQLKDFNFLTITFEESPVYIGNLKGE